MTRRLAVVAFLLGWAAGLAPLSADAAGSFRKGMSALDRRNYLEAVQHLEAAIREQPEEKPSEIRILGAWYEPYLPYFQLGVALLATGDCAGAEKAWAESVSQRVVVSLPAKAGQLRRHRETFAAKCPPAPRTVNLSGAEAGAAVAQALLEQLDRRIREVPEGSRAPLMSQREAAATTLDRARRELAAAREGSDQAAADRAAALADEAATLLRELIEEVPARPEPQERRKAPLPAPSYVD